MATTKPPRATTILALALTMSTIASTACRDTRAADTGRDAVATEPVKTLLSVDIPEPFDGKAARVTMVEVIWQPGASSASHRHPGPVFVYVVEGELETKIGDEPLRRLRAGDTLYEPTMMLHSATRNPSPTEPTRVIAMIVHPQDASEITIAAPDPVKP